MNPGRAVSDTNVLHAGLYSATGASYQNLQPIEQSVITPILTATLLFECEGVLRLHQKLLGLSNCAVNDVTDGSCIRGECRRILFLWRPHLSDPRDAHSWSWQWRRAVPMAERQRSACRYVGSGMGPSAGAPGKGGTAVASGEQVLYQLLRTIFSVEGWMVVMLFLALWGVIVLGRVRKLLQRNLEELERRGIAQNDEAVPRLPDIDLGERTE